MRNCPLSVLRDPGCHPKLDRVMNKKRNKNAAIQGSNPLPGDFAHEKELDAQLIMTERLASLGTIASGIAHELNNPLSYVIGNLEILGQLLEETSTRLNEELQENLLKRHRKIQAGITRIHGVVQDLKAFSNAEEEEGACCDVNAAIETAASMAAHEIKYKAKLEKELGSVPVVSGSATRLSQVFFNLILNAAQAISAGGVEKNRITIRTYMDPSGRVIAEVSDTGRGIPKEHLDRIYDPFFSTKEPGVGTGLGLPACHGIIQSLGGEILVQSEEGVGTTFKAVLKSGIPTP